jgi:hypothetical protein
MLSVIMLCVIILSVVAPSGHRNELHSGMFETIPPGTNALAYFASVSAAK